MKELGIDTSDEDEVIEFDLMGIYKTIGFIIEDTVDKDKNIAKIKRFQQKCSYFTEAFRSGSINFRVFDKIPNSSISRFHKIKEWKFIYIGTSDEMINNEINEKTIPQRSNLTVLNSEDLQYLEYLVKRTGSYARNEFFERLGVKIDESVQNLKEVTAIQLENKKILGTVKANVFLFQLSAEELLHMTRVPRYGSLKPWMPEVGAEGYQRILNQNKIEKLSEVINSSKGSTTFPNALTLVLSKDVKIEDPKISKEPDLCKLIIPYNYGVMEIIDGQHRLFGFAKSNLTEAQKKDTKLILIGIQFLVKTDREHQKLAAKTFVEINREQTKVPTELTYWLGYNTLGEISPKYIASRVLIKLSIEEKSNLKGIFHTRPFQRVNKLGSTPIKIVSVANELSKLFDIEKSKLSQNINLRSLFENKAWLNLEKRKDAEKIIGEAYTLLNDYFGIISSVFPKDWNSKDSLLFSVKYMTGFIKLLIDYKRNNYSKTVIASKLTGMESKIKDYLKTHGEHDKKLDSSPVVFWKNYDNIPSLRDSISKVTDFIIDVGK
jgi:DGQHR domain-containing protein